MQSNNSPAMLLPEVTRTRLSKKEARKLVNEINEEVGSVRRKIARLHDGEGWLALGYDSFKACVEGEFSISRQYAYQLLSAAQVDERVSGIVDTGPLPESHARELKQVPVEQQGEVYKLAVETAPQGKVTAEHLKQTVEAGGYSAKPWDEKTKKDLMNEGDYADAERAATPMMFMYVYLTLKSSISFRRRRDAWDAVRQMGPSRLARETDKLLNAERTDEGDA